MIVRFALLLLLSASPVLAQQVEPASELARYVRMLELEGKISGGPLLYQSVTAFRGGVHPDSTHWWAPQYALQTPQPGTRNVAIRPVDPEARTFFNSSFPRSSNDGALWAGRGISADVRAGLELSWGPLSAQLDPVVVYSQNREFPLAVGPTVYRYPWMPNIDFPQRFGNGSFQGIDWGQSGIRLNYRALTMGLSTENLWWGPALRNPILMSNAAAGFPHVDLGTRVAQTPIGAFEIRALWGALSRSDYFPSPGNGRRLLTGLTFGYRPSFLPGLTLGLSRTLYQEWPTNRLTADDVLAVFGVVFNPGRLQPDGSVINDYRDQLASLSARWALPAAGFEAFFEWARNDFAGSLKDLLIEPEHASGVTAGFQKALSGSGSTYLLSGEMTTLGKPKTSLLRDSPTFYVHHIAVEGYTHRGQILGAGIGPGSNSQYLGLDRYAASGRYGIFLERIRYDDDYAYRALIGMPFGYLSHQVDLTVGASVLQFVGRLDVAVGLEYTRELNRYFQRDNDASNIKLSFSLKRRLSGSTFGLD